MTIGGTGKEDVLGLHISAAEQEWGSTSAHERIGNGDPKLKGPAQRWVFTPCQRISHVHTWGQDAPGIKDRVASSTAPATLRLMMCTPKTVHRCADRVSAILPVGSRARGARIRLRIAVAAGWLDAPRSMGRGHLAPMYSGKVLLLRPLLISHRLLFTVTGGLGGRAGRRITDRVVVWRRTGGRGPCGGCRGSRRRRDGLWDGNRERDRVTSGGEVRGCACAQGEGSDGRRRGRCNCGGHDDEESRREREDDVGFGVGGWSRSEPSGRASRSERPRRSPMHRGLA